MSSIHTYPSQVADFMDNGSRKNPAGAESGADARQGAGQADEGMMFPWSIGTTAVAKERPTPRGKEECPPETYIG